MGVAGHERVGEILDRDFPVDVVDAPDAVVLLLRPGLVGRSRTEGGSELGDLAVMPDYEYYFARVLAAEKSGCQGAIVIVLKAVIDGQVECGSKRGHRLNGPVGVWALAGGEEDLRRWQIRSCAGGKDFGQETSAFEADGR